MNLFKDILYRILKLQEKLLRMNLGNTLNVKSSGRKRFMQEGCTLSLEALDEDKKNQMENELLIILKQCDYDPESLLKYIENQGTKVYRINNSGILHSIKENEGFIYPQKGLKAFYLSLILCKKFQFKTDAFFALSKGIINKFYFIYHFYNWYAYKHGISGMDSDSITMLNKYLFNTSDYEINKLQLADIYKLKDAIKQDKASIEFVLKLCRDMEGAKNAFKKLTEGGTSI